MSSTFLTSSWIKEIEEYASPPKKGSVEVEFRFREYASPNTPGVTGSQFFRILSSYKRIAPILTDEYAVTIDGKTYRKIVRADGRTSYMIKESKWRSDHNHYPLRAAVSIEYEADRTDLQYTFHRKKKRWSVFIERGIRLDMTSIEGEDRYEVEMEITAPNLISNQGLINSSLTKVFRQMFDTKEIYTLGQYKSVVRKFNRKLSRSSSDEEMDNKVLYQPRNLHIEDLVSGGIHDGIDKYTVTHKADGVRKLLYFDQIGIWAIMPPRSINLLMRLRYDHFKGAIIEGEMIPRENRLEGAPDSDYWFLVFDCLASPDGDIRQKNLTERIDATRDIAKTFQDGNTVLRMDVKSFYDLFSRRPFSRDDPFQNPVNFFFERMRHILNEQTTGLTYRTDGLVITPIDMPYDSGNDELSLRLRKLSSYPDICKWKPVADLTIDFTLLRVDGKLTLHSWDGEGFVPFEGLDWEPYDGSIDEKSVENVPLQSIVEMRWDGKQFVYIRTRDDKLYPNQIRFAKDTWSLIHLPIKRETLRGETIDLMIFHHNQIKTGLLSGYSDKILLDIGSGRGGDINRWREFRRIIAVEPNEEHIKELIKRSKIVFRQGEVAVVRKEEDLNHVDDGYLRGDRIFVIVTGGENSELIRKVVQRATQGKVDVVSSMLSMSFFWESSAMVNAFARTILENLSSDGEFIFLTIDGDGVREFFDPFFESRGPSLDDRWQKLGPVKIRRDGTGVQVDIPESIVGIQKEYLVRIDNLRLLLSQGGFILDQIKIADGETFLNQGERLLTSLYSFGKFVPVSSP